MEVAAEAQAREVLDFIARRGALAPEFRDLKVVHELLMVGSAEQQFQVSVGDGRYVNPAMLADRNKVPLAHGSCRRCRRSSRPRRAAAIDSCSRAKDEGPTFAIAFQPAYSSFVYLAVPETGESAPVFVRVARARPGVSTGRRDGAPTANDPTVTDQRATQRRRERWRSPTNDSGGTMGWLRDSSRVAESGPKSAPPSREEQAAVDDLRTFAAAENTCCATLGGYGMAGPAILCALGTNARSEPSTVNCEP